MYRFSTRSHASAAACNSSGQVLVYVQQYPIICTSKMSYSSIISYSHKREPPTRAAGRRVSRHRSNLGGESGTTSATLVVPDSPQG